MTSHRDWRQGLLLDVTPGHLSGTAVKYMFDELSGVTLRAVFPSSGMTLEALQNKLKAFLELRTADGPRHDTYLVFYSGHTLRTGAWAMAGQDTVT